MAQGPALNAMVSMNEVKFRKAILVGDGLSRDNIFDLNDSGNRDGCFEPYALLAERFLVDDIELHTPDQVDMGAAFELHMDVRPNLQASTPCYLMLLETPLIRPTNAHVPEHYRKVFTWNDSLIDGKRFIKLNFPNPLRTPSVDGLVRRDRFCCLIAGNKTPAQFDPHELYSERVDAIRWFEANAPHDFDLYGTDWDLPAAKAGLMGKASRHFWRQLAPWVLWRPFPSYKGRIARKFDVLNRTRFSICYENLRDMPRYITEKLFDSFFAGCIPVYWGASNVSEHIPPDCFIDRREFRDIAAVYVYLKSMTPETFLGYQRRIAGFIENDAARSFGASVFAETIVRTIVQDLASSS
jgi:hypothetical protein